MIGTDRSGEQSKVARIVLDDGHVALVDADVASAVRRLICWFNGRRVLYMRKLPDGRKRPESLARYIMGIADRRRVYYIDHDGLNNCRENLFVSNGTYLRKSSRPSPTANAVEGGSSLVLYYLHSLMELNRKFPRKAPLRIPRYLLPDIKKMVHKRNKRLRIILCRSGELFALLAPATKQNRSKDLTNRRAG